jgi:NAD(P)-dependent dehydrogenase (short-subunit alcohol dehydrogenase family)
MTTKSTVVILGASRGLGLAMVEEWLKRDAEVIATQRRASRNLSEPQGRYPGSLEIETVDIVEAASVHALRERLGGTASTCSSSMLEFAKPARRRRLRQTSATSST